MGKSAYDIWIHPWPHVKKGSFPVHFFKDIGLASIMSRETENPELTL